MELRHIRYFLALAEAQSFSRAATVLRITQPALSRQVQQLERELGVSLLERKARGVRLTLPGVAFRKRALRILTEAEEARTEAGRIERGQIGSLAIGFTDASVHSPVALKALRSYHERHPDIEIRLTSLGTLDQIEALHQGTLDAGIVIVDAVEAYPRLTFHRIQHYDVLLALPDNHALAPRPSLKLADLRNEGFVWPGILSQTGMHAKLIAACLAAGFSPRIIQEGSPFTTTKMVGAGLGIGFVHSSWQQVPVPNVVVKRVSDLNLEWPMHLATTRDNPSPVLANLVECAREIAKEEARKEAPTPRRPRKT